MNVTKNNCMKEEKETHITSSRLFLGNVAYILSFIMWGLALVVFVFYMVQTYFFLVAPFIPLVSLGVLLLFASLVICAQLLRAYTFGENRVLKAKQRQLLFVIASLGVVISPYIALIVSVFIFSIHFIYKHKQLRYALTPTILYIALYILFTLISMVVFAFGDPSWSGGEQSAAMVAIFVHGIFILHMAVYAVLFLLYAILSFKKWLHPRMTQFCIAGMLGFIVVERVYSFFFTHNSVLSFPLDSDMVYVGLIYIALSVPIYILARVILKFLKLQPDEFTKQVTYNVFIVSYASVILIILYFFVVVDMLLFSFRW